MKQMLLALLLIVGAAVAIYFLFPADGPYYPVVSYTAEDGSRLTFLQQPLSSEQGCRDTASRMVEPLRKQCPACVELIQCRSALSAEWRDALDGRPVRSYSVKADKQRILVTGVTNVQAANLCALIERQLKTRGIASARCLASGEI